MKICFVWLVPLLLMACARNDNSPQAQCERQAYNDPVVKQLYGSVAFMSGEVGVSGDERLRGAVHQATLKCLRERGLAPPGGVEPVQNY